MNKKIIMVSIIAVPLLVGGLIGYGIGHTPEREPAVSVKPEFADAPFTEASEQSQVRDSVSADIASPRQNAITRTVARCNPAVVGINVIEVRQLRYRSPWGDDPFFRNFFPDQVYTQQLQELGSGFII